MMSRHPACSSLQSDHLIEMEPDKGFTAVMTPQDCHHSHSESDSTSILALQPPGELPPFASEKRKSCALCAVLSFPILAWLID